VDPEDYQRELWRWLRGCTVLHSQPCPRIFLGFGSEDRFARAHRLLASVLPPTHVATVPGGHTWEPWRQLFAALLPRVARPRRKHMSRCTLYITTLHAIYEVRADAPGLP